MISMSREPLIVGIGGTTAANSSTEQALSIALGFAERHGVRTVMFGGASLVGLPHYLTAGSRECAQAVELVKQVRAAHGLIIASPGYHGSISGLVKNALDYLEETVKDQRVYLDGIPVGLIATAYGLQAATSTLAALRSVAHALRGWPTPLGAVINSAGGIFKDRKCTDAHAQMQLELMGRQVCEFARLRIKDPSVLETSSDS